MQVHTLREFNIAMESGPFINDLLVEQDDFP